MVSMHLLVLSAFRRVILHPNPPLTSKSQCTFWCSVLSDAVLKLLQHPIWIVSMHLLVLSAFRRHEEREQIQH